jgi:hypothetical protein
MLVCGFAVLMGRRCVLLGFFMLAERVVMLGLMMMMRGRVVVGGRLVMMLTGRMFRCLGHQASPSWRISRYRGSSVESLWVSGLLRPSGNEVSLHPSHLQRWRDDSHQQGERHELVTLQPSSSWDRKLWGGRRGLAPSSRC